MDPKSGKAGADDEEEAVNIIDPKNQRSLALALRLGGRVQFARFWSVFGSTVIDLTDAKEDPLSMADGYEPVRHRLGIAYEDDCLTLGITWRRDYQANGDARKGNAFQLRLAFRNIGI